MLTRYVQALSEGWESNGEARRKKALWHQGHKARVGVGGKKNSDRRGMTGPMPVNDSNDNGNTMGMGTGPRQAGSRSPVFPGQGLRAKSQERSRGPEPQATEDLGEGEETSGTA